MFKKIALTTIAASTLLISMQASAYSKHESSVNQEQREQATMIKQGIKTCAITPSEASKLKSTQQRIAKLEHKFKANGLSKWERKTLQDKLHAARVDINKMTKNRSTCRTDRHSQGRKHGASQDRHNGSNNYGQRSSNSRGSIAVTVRNVF
ncbi:hypothetical protein [Leucothrix arctica]|uniref:DUF1090 domain-containing protein n=1 Tax=Leucothrix arctica TaxID=1481894 RepID=A0A317CHH7_9GAMM|nr:hypothetical protein [Leucothrix arctica]PWQ95702.1 hypothetical protein DKT75_11755 [Leucothrix arctica]